MSKIEQQSNNNYKIAEELKQKIDLTKLEADRNSYFAAAGFCAACIFVVFSKSNYNDNIVLALSLLSVSAPLFLSLGAFIELAIKLGEKTYSSYLKISQHPITIVVSLAAFLCLLGGLGVMIFEVNEKAAWIFGTASAFAFVVYIVLQSKLEKMLRAGEN